MSGSQQRILDEDRVEDGFGVPLSGKWAGVPALPMASGVEDVWDFLLPWVQSAKRTAAIIRKAEGRLRYAEEEIDEASKEAKAAVNRITYNVRKAKELDVFLGDPYWRRTVEDSEIHRSEEARALAIGRAVLSVRDLMESFERFTDAYRTLDPTMLEDDDE
jgi:hypothetical protein